MVAARLRRLTVWVAPCAYLRQQRGAGQHATRLPPESRLARVTWAFCFNARLTASFRVSFSGAASCANPPDKQSRSRISGWSVLRHGFSRRGVHFAVETGHCAMYSCVRHGLVAEMGAHRPNIGVREIWGRFPVAHSGSNSGSLHSQLGGGSALAAHAAGGSRSARRMASRSAASRATVPAAVPPLLQLSHRRLQHRTGRDNHRALDEVLQFPDVARPMIARQRLHRLGRNGQYSPVHAARDCCTRERTSRGMSSGRSRSGTER